MSKSFDESVDSWRATLGQLVELIDLPELVPWQLNVAARFLARREIDERNRVTHTSGVTFGAQVRL